MSALLEVDNLSKQFVTRSRLFRRQVNEASWSCKKRWACRLCTCLSISVS